MRAGHAALALLCLVVAGCRQAAGPHAAAGRTGPPVVVFRSEPVTLNPLRAVDPVSEELAGLLYPGLAALDPDSGHPVPDLAEGWQWRPDGRAITVTLRADAAWADGSAVRAADAAATLRAKGAIQQRDDLPWPLGSVREHDDRTIVIEIDHGGCAALHALTTGLLPAGSTAAAVVEADPWSTERLRLEGGGHALPLGAGAVVFRGWTPDGDLAFAPRRESASAGDAVPTRDALRVRIEPSPSAGLAALFAGEADAVPVEAKDVPLVGEQVAAGAPLRVSPIATRDLVLLVLNLADPGAPEAGWSDLDGDGRRDGSEPWLPQRPHPVLGDLRVRRAVALAIDAEAVIEQVTFGRGTPISAPSDTAAAEGILAEAGWTPGKPEEVRTLGGRPLAARIVVSRGNQPLETVAEGVARDLRRVGMAVSVERSDYGAVLADVLGQTFDMALLEARDVWAPNDAALAWTREEDVPGIGRNVASLADPAVDALARAQGAAPCTGETRDAALRDLRSAVAAHGPFVALYAPARDVAWNERLGRYRPSPWSGLAAAVVALEEDQPNPPHPPTAAARAAGTDR